MSERLEILEWADAEVGEQPSDDARLSDERSSSEGEVPASPAGGSPTSGRTAVSDDASSYGPRADEVWKRFVDKGFVEEVLSYKVAHRDIFEESDKREARPKMEKAVKALVVLGEKVSVMLDEMKAKEVMKEVFVGFYTAEMAYVLSRNRDSEVAPALAIDFMTGKAHQLIKENEKRAAFKEGLKVYNSTTQDEAKAFALMFDATVHSLFIEVHKRVEILKWADAEVGEQPSDDAAVEKFLLLNRLFGHEIHYSQPSQFNKSTTEYFGPDDKLVGVSYPDQFDESITNYYDNYDFRIGSSMPNPDDSYRILS